MSFYQDDPDTSRGIDFLKMKAAGAQFSIIRAGQNLWEDNEFDISWAASKGVLPRGSYWFYDSRVDPKLQARKWLSCFADPNDLGEFGFWCDFEERYGGAFTGWKHWYTFIEELRRIAPNAKIGIYTGYYYWREFTIAKNIPAASLQYFKQFPLWIAHYKVDTPLVPAPWSTWTLWQYTDDGNGKTYGVESNEIDLNYFNGSEVELASFTGNQPQQEPEKPTPQSDPIVKARLFRKSGKVEEL